MYVYVGNGEIDFDEFLGMMAKGAYDAEKERLEMEVNLYLYIIHVYIHTYLHTYIHTYSYINIYIFIYTYIRTYIFTVFKGKL